MQKLKQQISAALKRIGLEKEVSLDEIEKEIRQVDTAFQSLLILGVVKRILHQNDEEAMRLFVPAITEWKNHLPHNDLGGASPAEMMEKHPPGLHRFKFDFFAKKCIL